MTDSSLEAAVAQVLRDHLWWFVGTLGVPGMPDSKDYKCACGWTAGGGIGVGEDPHEHVATAVIEALALKPEQKTLADGYVGMTTNTKTGETTVSSRPCTRMQRFCTPWVSVDREDLS